MIECYRYSGFIYNNIDIRYDTDNVCLGTGFRPATMASVRMFYRIAYLAFNVYIDIDNNDTDVYVR